jgi:IS30 family transposase
MLVKVSGKDTESVVNALIMNARKLSQELYKSLTWDRGKEMADRLDRKRRIQFVFQSRRSR